MPKILAYQCPRTKAVFTNRDIYASHLLVQRKRSFDCAKQKRLARTFMEQLTLAHQTLTTPEQISQWMVDHTEEILSYAYGQRIINNNFCNSDYIAYRGDFKFTSFDFVTSYKKEVKFSRGVPYGKKIDRNNKVYYAGLSGKVNMAYTGGHGDFPTTPFNIPGISIGGGGGSSRGSTYEVTIWFDNWTALADRYGMEAMSRKIMSGTKS